MKIALLLAAALVPSLASADDPRAYVVHNGRGATSAPAAPAPAAPAFIGTTSQTSTFGSNAVHPNISMGDGSPAALAAAASAASAAASGSRNFRSKRSISGKRGIGTVRKDTGSTPPQSYSKPGALVRTEGQLPVYTATNDAATHAVEGGTFVSQDPRHTVDSNRGPGVVWGAPDKAPSPNPGSGGSGSGITQNAAPGSFGGLTGSVGHGDSGQNSASTSGFDPAF